MNFPNLLKLSDVKRNQNRLFLTAALKRSSGNRPEAKYISPMVGVCVGVRERDVFVCVNWLRHLPSLGFLVTLLCPTLLHHTSLRPTVYVIHAPRRSPSEAVLWQKAQSQKAMPSAHTTPPRHSNLWLNSDQLWIYILYTESRECITGMQLHYSRCKGNRTLP